MLWQQPVTMGAQCCINKFNFSSAHLASAPALWLCNKANICRVLLLRGSLSWRMISDAAVTQRGQMTGPIRRPYVRGTPHSLSDRSLSLICPQLLCSLNLWDSVCGFSAMHLHIFSFFFFFVVIIIYFPVKKITNTYLQNNYQNLWKTKDWRNTE